ncbi:hypothetical protein SLS59_001697 [Nothophoma quercina]|uniref:Uncharacterized protein n=1 Tax=Nothophoma quercina TaxID=749835 RepID=A0ABR3RY49_9PLEO
MGDSTTNDIPKRPGVMIVRPSLHTHNKENTATFKRWTVMHFRDLLNCTPPTPGAQGISRTMRYFNTAGELFYTIHADDIRIWKTKAYYDVSRRLDLESIRAVEEGEEAVMPEKHDFGDEPMVWNLVNAEFSICSTHSLPNHQLGGAEWVKPYHSIPLSLLSPNGKTPGAPPSLLVTLTYTGPEDEEHDTSAPQRLLDLQAEAVKHLKSDYADDETLVFSKLADFLHVESYDQNMGDIPSPSTPSRRPGIAIVRPKLHSNTPQNRDLFMRWTKLHLRDTLSLPPDPDFGRVTKMLRFKRADANGEEEYLFTNHFEDLRLLREGELPAKTSQRLDLENQKWVMKEWKAK